MKQLAYELYLEGYGCGQCIIRAADIKYKLGISEDVLRAVGALGNGCGYGGICTVITAALMIFGIMFEESTAKMLRIKLLDEFYQKYGSFNCCTLSAKQDCKDIIGYLAVLMERLIAEEL